jgi:hypothetical protein
VEAGAAGLAGRVPHRVGPGAQRIGAGRIARHPGA